jgi:hypothetical protein
MFGVSYQWCRLRDGDFVLPSTTPSQFDPVAYVASLALLGSYAPQRLYLTHYGALDYSLEKAQLLERQIHAYCEFARAETLDIGHLQQQLGDYTLELLHQFGAPHDEALLRQFLAADMQLNAQGLQLWQQRSTSA